MIRSVIAVLALATVVHADEGVDYLRDVKPILTRRCVSCHGSLKQKNSLRLDTAALARQGGTSGPAFVPGKSAESLLIEHVTASNGSPRMPPEGEPLTAEQIEILKKWIDQGAKSPEEKPAEDPAKHWSFVPPVRPPVPQPAAAPFANPIDAFVAAEWKPRDLQPLGEAPRHVLLRRVFLDLTGLPPTPLELEAFLGDASPDAFEKVVDQLLASPHYGERWGRHWMDVWRYSDWDGFGAEVRESKPHIWRWRDWIIDSLNAGKPYDQMVREMLAGDEIAPGDPQTVRATGFLVRNWYMFNRNVWLDWTVEHTSKAFLGVTLNCARCHDHMYDPIPQQDYYRMRAFFEPHEVRIDRVPGEPDLTKGGVARVYDANATAKTFLYHRGEEKQADKDHPLAPGVPEILARQGNPLAEAVPVALPAASFYPGARDFEQQEALAAAQSQFTQAQAAADIAARGREAAVRQASEFATKGAPTRHPLFSDDFAVARPDVWTYGAGMWQYRDGRLTQAEPAERHSMIVAQLPLPRDFAAGFRFRTTGGATWKSVGLSFDWTDDANFHSVYASAYAGGPKVQISHRSNGQDQYPPAGAKALPVELNREHELRVFVRDRQMNVAFDGKLILVYSLPDRRPDGRISLWTYDASAEFLSVFVEPLPSEIPLATAEGQPLPESPTAESLARVAEESDRAFAIAGKKRDIAEASLAFVNARTIADNARYGSVPAADAETLAVAAAAAERSFALRQAELKLLEAEHLLAQSSITTPEARTKAEAAVATAQKARDEARMAAEQVTSQYTRLGPTFPETSSGRRLALANWITSRTSPLTARVAANHIWMRHFNQPLVSTVFDFGLNGKRPSHPALLDWLAVELMDSGWKMKPLHRLIVTSQAYRRASSASASDASLAARNRRLDPENVFFWRANARRLEAELVRDATLAVAGSLDTTPAGPDLDPAQWLVVPRRSVYFRSSKEKRMTFVALFDSANVVECYRRSESIVPQQALAMANSPLAIIQSRVLAENLTRRLGMGDGTEEAFVGQAFLHLLSRPPTGEEQSQCLQFLASQSQRLVTGGTLTAFTSGESSAVKPSADPRQRARESLVHVLLNHNDFVTVR